MRIVFVSVTPIKGLLKGTETVFEQVIPKQIINVIEISIKGITRFIHCQFPDM